eukprot:CAMPEP_0115096590 /NCGR_PEP_ID=MMETSP0227-20121206/29827_1 /TAXON_ID=89957 /ORGANISM="Polarella glacialis, Strain CCMP 1383" /LENGTH=65 /DNA_ID=CAMNT_0002490379 /DNA_START=64 /DNA_END=258 /DNA_ORIENTATION=+
MKSLIMKAMVCSGVGVWRSYCVTLTNSAGTITGVAGSSHNWDALVGLSEEVHNEVACITCSTCNP